MFESKLNIQTYLISRFKRIRIKLLVFLSFKLFIIYLKYIFSVLIFHEIKNYNT